MSTLPIKIALFYDADSYTREDAEAFCADLPPEMVFECEPIYRRGVTAPPDLFWQVAGGLAALSVFARGFFDELGRPLGKEMGKDAAGVYRTVRDRLFFFFSRRTNPLPPSFIIWVDEEHPRQFQFGVHVRGQKDLDRMFAALLDGVRIAERLLAEYRGRRLSQAMLRFDTDLGPWLVHFLLADGELIPGEQLRSEPEPPEASP